MAADRFGGKTYYGLDKSFKFNIEAKVNRLVVPLSYANELYTLKLHIDRVRAKVLGGTGFHPAGVAQSDTPSEPLVPAT